MYEGGNRTMVQKGNVVFWQGSDVLSFLLQNGGGLPYVSSPVYRFDRGMKIVRFSRWF